VEVVDLLLASGADCSLFDHDGRYRNGYMYCSGYLLMLYLLLNFVHCCLDMTSVVVQYNMILNVLHLLKSS